MNFTVSFDGSELVERMKQFESRLYDDEMNRVFLRASQALAAVARRNAPVGKHASFGLRGRSEKPRQAGRLRKAIIAKAYSKSTVQRYGPGAFAQVNLQRRFVNTAPYGHIVEGGRQRTTTRTGKMWAWYEGGSGLTFVRKREVRGFAGRYFFRRAIDTAGPRLLQVATTEAIAQIEKRYS